MSINANLALQEKVKALEKALAESEEKQKTYKEIVDQVAIKNYEQFNNLPEGSATLNQVEESCAEVIGWATFGKEVPKKVKKEKKEKKVKKVKKEKKTEKKARPLSGYIFFTQQEQIKDAFNKRVRDGEATGGKGEYAIFMGLQWKALSKEEQEMWKAKSIEAFNRSQKVKRHHHWSDNIFN